MIIGRPLCGGFRGNVKRASRRRLCRGVVTEKVLRIDRPMAGGFSGLTGLLGPRVVVAAGAAIFKGARLRRRLCRRVASLALRGQRPFGPRVADCRSASMLIKSALRD